MKMIKVPITNPSLPLVWLGVYIMLEKKLVVPNLRRNDMALWLLVATYCPKILNWFSYRRELKFVLSSSCLVSITLVIEKLVLTQINGIVANAEVYHWHSKKVVIFPLVEGFKQN